MKRRQLENIARLAWERADRASAARQALCTRVQMTGATQRDRERYPVLLARANEAARLAARATMRAEGWRAAARAYTERERWGWDG